MAKKGYTPEQIINKLREAEIHINQGMPIACCQSAKWDTFKTEHFGIIRQH